MSLPVIIIDSTLADAAERLAEVSESPRLDAETLLAWVLDVPRSYLFGYPQAELNDKSTRNFSDALARRHHGEPVALRTINFPILRRRHVPLFEWLGIVATAIYPWSLRSCFSKDMDIRTPTTRIGSETTSVAV